MTQPINQGRYDLKRFENPPKGELSPAQRIHRQFQAMDQSSDQLIFVSANQTPPETPVSKAQGKIKQGRWALVGTLALSLLGLLGGFGVRSYVQNQPDRITVNQSEALHKNWTAFANKARESGLDQQITPREQVEVNQSFRSLLLETLDVMQKYPRSEINQDLYTRLEAAVKSNADLVPVATVSRISNDLENYLRKALNTAANPSPSDREIEAVFQRFQAEFTDLTPELQQLSSKQKQQFTQDVKETVKSLRPISQNHSISSQLKAPIRGVLSQNFAGMDWNRVMNLNGEEDAIAVFQSVVSNTENFREMGSAEREAFLKYGTEVLTSLEYTSPSPAYGLFTVALLLAGFGGAAGLAYTRQEDIFKMSENQRELERALDNPVLIVSNIDQGHMEGRRRLEELETTISQSTHQLADTLKTVYNDPQYPEIKAFLLDIFGNEAKLPNAAWFQKKLEYTARQDILSQMSREDRLAQKPVSQLAIWERVAMNAEAATETGELLPYSDIEALEADANLQRSENDPKRRAVLVERAKIDNLIFKGIRGYANRIFAVATAQENAKKREAEVQQAQQDFVTYGQQANSNQDELTRRRETWENAKIASETAKRTLKGYQDLALLADDMMESAIKPLKEYRERLSKALIQQDMTTSIEDLRKVEDASGKTHTDEALQKVLDEQTVEEFLREEDARTRQLEEKVKARVQQRRAEKSAQATPRLSTAQGGKS